MQAQARPRSVDSLSGSAKPRGERLAPEEKLRNSRDYLGCYRRGRRVRGDLFDVVVRRRVEGELPHTAPRLGITASRKVGKAVLRNKAKRRIREIFRRWPDRYQLPAQDIVVHLKPDVTEASFDEIRVQLLLQIEKSLKVRSSHRPRRGSKEGSRRRSSKGRSNGNSRSEGTSTP